MFEKFKAKLANTSKEALKEEIKTHLPEILSGATTLLVLYLCIKVNNKPINVIVNVHGGYAYGQN